MADEKSPVVAESSPATANFAENSLSSLSHEQRAEWRKTGEFPKADAKPEVATAPAAQLEEPPASDTGKDPDSESADASAKPAADPEPAKDSQENKAPSAAEKRLNHLLGNLRRAGVTPAQIAKMSNEEIQSAVGKLDAPAEKADAKTAAPSPAAATSTRPKPDIYATNPDGTAKYKTNEEFVEDLTDWKVEQQTDKLRAEMRQAEQNRYIVERLNEGKARYADFDDVMPKALNGVMSDEKVSTLVKAMVAESEILPDLLYALGSDADALESFLQDARTAPGKALRYVALVEAETAKTLKAGKSKPAEEAEEPPAKPPIQRTAKPVSEVGGRGAAPPDAADNAVRSGDYSRAKAEWNRQAIAGAK